MPIVERTRQIMRGLMKSYGPTSVKKRLWEEEFTGTHWDFINDTAGDCVYAPLEKYAAHGSILDLGCGPGNTANELSFDAYETYVGVDISDAALEKGVRRSQETGRMEKNRFQQADILKYEPSQKFDVILFRESMYHVPLGKVKSMLDRYSKYLKPNGVFMVRMVAWGARLNSSQAKFDVMESEFEVVAKIEHGERGPIVLVFRPRRPH